MQKTFLSNYASSINEAIKNARFTNENNSFIYSEDAIQQILKLFLGVRKYNGKLIFIGNGGSAAISSHMAEDYSKTAGIRATNFNDAPLLTCLANDYSFEQIFEKAIEIYANPGDVLIAVSSSGKSTNILRGVSAAKEKQCRVVTLSGFRENNPLSKLGHLNIHLPSDTYGIVEISHELFLHSLLDYIAANHPAKT